MTVGYLLLSCALGWAATPAGHISATAVSPPAPTALGAPAFLPPPDRGVHATLPDWLAAGSGPGGVPAFNPCCPIGINCTAFCHGPGHAVCDDGACICVCN
jgi:hypothetical protein